MEFIMSSQFTKQFDKPLVILSVVACSYAAKLDRTYLPPANAATAGGSPGSLIAPGNGPSGSVPLTFIGPSGNLGSGQSPFGKPSTPALGQQSVSSFGQLDGSFNNQPTGQGFNQPSAFGFQTPNSQFRQPVGESSFGKPNAVGPTLTKAPIGFGQAPTSFGQSPQEQPDFQRYQPERARASIDSNAEILRYDNQNDGETFAYSFETSNGISAEESGVATNGVRAQGGFAYTDDDGQVIRLTYTADEKGYQPQGDHLPTPHPIPEEILKSIEQNARAAAAGTQEGAYNPNEDVYTPQQFNGVASAYKGQGGDSSQYAYNQPQGQSPGQGRGSSQNAYNQLQSQSPGQGRDSSQYAYNQQQIQSPGQARGSSQNAYNQPQGQSPGGARGSSQNAYNQPQGQSPGGPRGSSQNAYNQPQGQSLGGARGSSQNAYNQPQGQSPAQGRGSSQNAYNQPQGQIPASQFGSLSFESEVSKQTPLAGSFGIEGSNKPAQSTTGFTQNKESLSSGYQYNQPQANVQFGRPSASFSQTGGQYRPESVPSGQPQGTPVASSPRESDKGFAPSGSNGQTSTRPSAGSPLSGKPKGSLTESSSTFTGFGPALAFGQSPSTPVSQGSRPYQPSQTESGSSMPAQSSPYQYNRPSQQVAPSQQTGTQAGSRPTTEQVTSTQKFGAPRQPPSFTDEEGYKY